jgi:transposase-like protein
MLRLSGSTLKLGGLQMANRASDEKRREWTDRLLRHEMSELTVARFCEDEGVSVPSFYQWRRKLKDAERARPSVPSFQPLHVTVAAGGPAVVARLPNGVVLEVAEAAVDAVVGRLLAES